jgi:hypothetical protein
MKKIVAKIFGGCWGEKLPSVVVHCVPGFFRVWVFRPVNRFFDCDCRLFILRVRIRLLEFKIWIKDKI